MIIDEVFGTPSHFMKSISSSGKFLFIDFQKTSGSTLELVASIKYKKIDPECQTWLHNNILITPNNPTINCSWIITRKYGSYITLDFSYLEVKPLNITNKKYT